MSMNIHISSEGVITTPNGMMIDYYKSFNCFQTPSKVSYEIIELPNPIQGYRDWVMAREKIEIIDVHDINVWDNNTGYYKVIGTEEYSACRKHIEELEKFISDEEDKGFKIVVSVS